VKNNYSAASLAQKFAHTRRVSCMSNQTLMNHAMTPSRSPICYYGYICIEKLRKSLN